MNTRIPLTQPDPKRDHISGSADGLIKLLEYGDYECPFCAEAQPIVKEIQRQLGDDLLFAFRHFPLTNIHPHAEHAAEAAEAAGVQGNFWGMHDLLFENQGALEDENLAAYAAGPGLDKTRLIREVVWKIHKQRIREDFKSGVRGDVNGTPTFFINGKRYDGDLNLKYLLNALKPQRAKRRSPSPNGKNTFRLFEKELATGGADSSSFVARRFDVRSKRA
jgi:protein-disulfide isomerase